MKPKLKKYACAVERTAERFPAYIRKPKAISHCALYAGSAPRLYGHTCDIIEPRFARVIN